jgi:fluoroacetyl-CoA thioesterase
MADSTMSMTGSTATISHQVSDADIARTLGTGDGPVLASSRLLTWAEQATCAAIEAELDDASISVGIGLRIEHLQPSPLDTTVSVRAELVHVDGRQLVFQVRAEHDDGEVVGRGEVTRMVLERERFLQGVAATG